MADVCKTMDSHHTPKYKHKIGDKRAYKKTNGRIKKYRCTLCKFATSYHNSLKRHIKLKHQKLKPKPTAKRKTERSDSYEVQFLKKLFGCTHCPYSSKWRSAVQRHSALKHDLRLNLLDCCGKRYENRPALSEHIKSYHFERPKGKFDQHASSSEQKQTVEFDSNEWNRKNSIVTNESEEETSLSSLSTDQSVLQAGSFVKIYINETGNILTEEQDADADQTSTTNRIRTAPVRENKPRVDDSVANGRKRFSKRTKVKGVSEAGFHENIVDKRQRSILKEEEAANSSHPVCAGIKQHLLNRSPSLEFRRSDRITEQKTHQQLTHGQPNSASQSHLLINSINDEARKWRLQISLIKNTSALKPLLERLLELLASIMNEIHEAKEAEIRFKAIECFEYVWNTSKIVIVRWGHLNSSIDSFFNAIQYIYGTLPVFIDWERKEHLDMLDNGILLSLCTVKNWTPLSFSR